MSGKALELSVSYEKPTGKTKDFSIPRDADRQMHAVSAFGSPRNGGDFFPPIPLAIANRADQITFQQAVTGRIEIDTKNPSRGQFGKVRPPASIGGDY